MDSEGTAHPEEISVRAAIFHAIPGLTSAERKLAQAVLADYPFNALQTVVDLAARTGVSPPTITRFVAKLGFAGYAEFQRHLIAEIKQARLSPLDLGIASAAQGPDDAGDYALRAAGLLGEMRDAMPPGLMQTVADLLADRSRRISLLGGRVTDHIAGYLAVHLQQVREAVVHLPPVQEQWPDHILRMRRQDVLMLFDVRRYQPDLALLARQARAARNVQVVLVTDTWLSPIARQATHVFALPIGIGTAWDTGITALALAEELVIRVSDADWPAARRRIAALDALRPGAGASAPPPPTAAAQQGTLHDP